MTTYNTAWTETEDALLREHYTKGGAKACQAVLPNRTKKAIRCRAHSLDITFSGSRRSVQVDEDKVVELYKQHHTAESVANLLNLSEYVIERTIRKHKIVLPPYRSIDQHKDAILADYWPATLTTNALADKYQVSRSELVRALRRWGVKDPDRQKKLAKNGAMRPNRKPMYACWVDTHGKEEADRRWKAWIDLQSELSRGENNPMYGKPAPQGAGNGWKGWYGPHHFRSLREACFMITLDLKGIKWQGGESICIPYEFNGTKRNYRPDFLVNDKVVTEIKPLKMQNTPNVVAKQKAAQAFCAELGLEYELIDIVVDPEVLCKAYLDGKIRFERDYEQRFRTYHEKRLAGQYPVKR